MLSVPCEPFFSGGVCRGFFWLNSASGGCISFFSPLVLVDWRHPPEIIRTFSPLLPPLRIKDFLSSSRNRNPPNGGAQISPLQALDLFVALPPALDAGFFKGLPAAFPRWLRRHSSDLPVNPLSFLRCPHTFFGKQESRYWFPVTVGLSAGRTSPHVNRVSQPRLRLPPFHPDPPFLLCRSPSCHMDEGLTRCCSPPFSPRTC